MELLKNYNFKEVKKHYKIFYFLLLGTSLIAIFFLLPLNIQVIFTLIFLLNLSLVLLFVVYFKSKQNSKKLYNEFAITKQKHRQEVVNLKKKCHKLYMSQNEKESLLNFERTSFQEDYNELLSELDRVKMMGYSNSFNIFKELNQLKLKVSSKKISEVSAKDDLMLNIEQLQKLTLELRDFMGGDPTKKSSSQ